MKNLILGLSLFSVISFAKPEILVGKVQSGMMAIGGETTGIELTVEKPKKNQPASVELDFENKEDRKKAIEWKGKKIQVEGEYTVFSGIERPQRKILKVKKIELMN